MSNKTVIPVVGGMMRLIFGGIGSTGPTSDTHPGIMFEVESDGQLLPMRDAPGLFYGGTGVISRSDARKLAAELIRMADEGDTRRIGDDMLDRTDPERPRDMAERAARYHAAFEAGDMSPSRYRAHLYSIGWRGREIESAVGMYWGKRTIAP